MYDLKCEFPLYHCKNICRIFVARHNFVYKFKSFSLRFYFLEFKGLLMKSLGIIPARWGSSRFEGKPLAKIAGK